MTVSIDIWLDELRSVAPGCTEDIALQVTKATLREFYNRSGMWVETLTGLATTTGVSTLNLSAAAILAGYDANVISTWHIKYDDTYLKPQHVLDTSPTGDIPLEFYGESSGLLTLIPTPAATVANIMEARVTLVPAFTTDVVPDDANAVWFDEIKDGVLGHLYQQPGKTYTNLASAQYHLRRFYSGISRARDTARRRYTQTETSWAFPAFA